MNSHSWNAASIVAHTPTGRPGLRTVAVVLLLSVTLSATASEAPCLHWQPTQPIVDIMPAVAYDIARQRVVLFGGLRDGPPFLSERAAPSGDTWEYDGQHWQRLLVAGPSPRYGACMAYDSLRGVVVLFGGNYTAFSPDSYLQDTWEWDGTAWSRRATDGPSPRYGAAMSFDVDRGVTVLHSGWGPLDTGEIGALRDTWEWDGQTWKHRASTAPGRRPNAAMAYDELRRETVLTGGWPMEVGGTWAWDGAQWTKRDLFYATSLAAAAYDGNRGVTALLYGTSSGFNTRWQLREWDGTAWSAVLAELVDPVAPYSTVHSAFDAVGGRTLFFARWPALAPAYAWDGSTLTRVEHVQPAGRHSHAMAYDTMRGQSVLFGGYVETARNGETWGFDGTDWTLLSTTGPAPRVRTALVYDAARDRIVLFGGETAAGRNAETWLWDGSAWQQQAISGPSARHSFAMAYDPDRQRVVLHGGWVTTSAVSAETWEYDWTAWTRVSTTGPAARAEHAMAYDAHRQAMVLHGGRTGGSSTGLADTWEWDGTTWQARGTHPNLARYSHALAYDPRLLAVVLEGGQAAYGASERVAVWDGTQWHELDLVSPATHAAVAFDGARNVLLRHGGLQRGLGSAGERGSAVLCALEPAPPYFTQSPADQRVTTLQPAVFSVATTTDACATGYQWYHDGVPLADDGRITGSATATLRLSPAVVADAGHYMVTAKNGPITLSSVAAELTVLLAGDVNCDGTIDAADVDAFVLAIVDADQYAAAYPDCDARAADCNGDGAIDTADIDAFVALIVNAR